MPNWCSNALVIRQGIDSFTKHALRGQSEFRFSHLLPRPEALDQVSRGTTTIDGRRVNAWRDTPEGPVEVDVEELARTYGAADWYEWSIQNWGTKWDISKSRMEGREDGLWIWFDTAWSPPISWLQRACANFPEWAGEMAYAEGGMGFHGVVRFSGGRVSDESGEADFWAASDEDEDECEPTPEVAAHLEAYGLHMGG
jgi:hypothetical protein